MPCITWLIIHSKAKAMITDAETNFVYFSELLRQKPEYRNFHEQLCRLLKKHNIAHDYISETRDIWCRDYMPVQVRMDKYIGFSYDPDYLKGEEWEGLRTYSDLLHEPMSRQTVKSDIVLDGGNVIKGKNKVILTDKVLTENSRNYSPERLIGKLQEHFEVDIIILIPWDKSEIYGHADGMIRFINDDHVLINGYFRAYGKKFRNNFFGAIESNHLSFTELTFDVPHPDENLNWGYINFLQMDKLLIVPQFDIREDDQAVAQIKKAFPAYAEKCQIETLNSRDIIQHGGVLNCASWNIIQ